MTLALDVLLGLGLIWLALQTVRGATLFRSIVLFIVFGLVMALAWARLGAPDLALAEAAIGAGITGALLLATYGRLADADPEKKVRPYRRRSRLAGPIGILVAALVAAIGRVTVDLPAGAGTAGQLAQEALADTGIANPVTGVLLAFRGYDTLLELAVLLTVWLGMRAVVGDDAPPAWTSGNADLPLVRALLAVVVPLTILIAGHLLHAGGFAPGGAFQAGAVLAAGGVLLALTGRLRPVADAPLWQLVCLIVGVLTFSAVGLGVLAAGQPTLALPGYWAVYVLEAALMISVATTLVLLFLGAGGMRR